MTFVVTDSCILCKYTDCVDVCPVDCFYEGANMLVINPDECIDCGICEPECPAAAILPDSYPEAEEWLDLNREFSAKWPNIADSKPALPEAAEYLDRPAKFKEFFDPEPAVG